MDELIEAVNAILQSPCPACGALFYIAHQDEKGKGWECRFCYLRISVYQADKPFELLVSISGNQEEFNTIVRGVLESQMEQG